MGVRYALAVCYHIFRKSMKSLYIAIGILAVLLGAIGVFVPGLPTTPLVLLASWCFYRSSPRMQAWLLSSFLGKYILDYTVRGGITTRKRIYIILLMTIMVAISTIFFIHTFIVRVIVWLAGFVGCVVVAFFVPKARR